MNSAKFYNIVASNGRSVLVRRGMSAPIPTGGGGNWQTKDRPRRRGITVWEGEAPYQMDVPILFDGWQSHKSIESDIAAVNQMRFSPGELVPPPTIHVQGALPVNGATWVIDDITWDADSAIWASAGQKGYRLRQAATLHLLQYVAEDRIKLTPAAATQAKTTTVKGKQTLRSIAANQYGDHTEAKRIAKANGIRDPKTIKPGQTIKIPSSPKPAIRPDPGAAAIRNKTVDDFRGSS